MSSNSLHLAGARLKSRFMELSRSCDIESLISQFAGSVFTGLMVACQMVGMAVKLISKYISCKIC